MHGFRSLDSLLALLNAHACVCVHRGVCGMHLCASRSSDLLLARIFYDQPSGFMFVHKTFLGTRMHVCAYTH